MILFPLIYLTSFILAFKGILKNNRQEIFLFFIFGLSIYNTTLSITYDMGLTALVTILKFLKEIVVVLLLTIEIWTLKKRVRFHLIDYAVITFFIYTFIYVLIPIGGQSFAERIASFKNISFFPLVYFTGRLFNIQSFYLNKYLHFILYLTIAAAGLALIEYISYQHFQTFTGYADYQFYVYNFEPTGSYGLTYTFETDAGLKRFASFFSGPLEHAGATLLSLAVVITLSTTNNNKIRINFFGITSFIATLICIFLALSRSSFLSYFIIIYVYALLTRKKMILHAVHSLLLTAILYVIFLLRDNELFDFIVSTLNFTNPSSIGHLVEWIEGINSLISNPLGIGLGSSGILAGAQGENIGGENQFIIIGVQTGIIPCALYLFIYLGLIKVSWRHFRFFSGKGKKICMLVFLIKIGYLIPSITSELELSSYISYITWFFSGLLMNIIMNKYPFSKGNQVTSD